MKNDRIHQLIEKYLEGNTTLEEERFLEEYFSGVQDVDDDLRPLKDMFELFRKGKNITFDSSVLEAGILKRIEGFENEQEPPVRKLNFSRLLVAASIALFITITGILVVRVQQKQFRDTYSDPQLAYLETQKTLLLISQKLNQGMKPLSNISKINTGTEQLKKLEKIDESMGMLNLVSFINHSSNLKK